MLNTFKSNQTGGEINRNEWNKKGWLAIINISCNFTILKDEISMVTLQAAQLIINEAIVNIKYKQSPDELYAPMRYILDLGGKRIRPSLTLLACNVFSENVSSAVDAAVALEVFHNFTLVHDDIMDNANLRRGEPTIHSKWNNNIAILSGDGMCIKAYEQLSKCPTEYFKAVFDVFNKTALEVCEGQQFDMNFEHLDSVTEAQYLIMISLKTSVLLAACMKIGAITGGASEKDAELMYRFGHSMGLGFQLQDDLLDVYGNEATFGKEIGKDIVANKKTFLLIKALDLANDRQRTELKHWITVSNYNREEKIKAVTEIYNQLSIKELTIAAINGYFDDAQNQLNAVSADEERKVELKKFLLSIKNRSY